MLYGYLSEAYFLRSLSYFYLVRIFKDVPLVLEPTETDASNFYFPKTDGDEVLNQIRQDLENIRNYATIDGYATSRKSKDGQPKQQLMPCWRILHFGLLTMRHAYSYVQNIEASGKYVLMPSAKWFEIFYPGNSLEGIFEFQFDNSQNQTNNSLWFNPA